MANWAKMNFRTCMELQSLFFHNIRNQIYITDKFFNKPNSNIFNVFFPT